MSDFFSFFWEYNVFMFVGKFTKKEKKKKRKKKKKKKKKKK